MLLRMIKVKNYWKLATLIFSHLSINIEHIFFWNVALYKTWKLLPIASLNKGILFTIMIGNKRYLAFSWKMLHSYLFHQLGWAQILESVYNWIFAESTGMNCNFVQLIGHALTYTHKLWDSQNGLREWVQSYKNVIEHLKCEIVHYFLFIRIIKWK